MAESVSGRYMKLAEAAAYLGITEAALRNRISRGQLPLIRDGRRISFDRLALDRHMQGRRTPITDPPPTPTPTREHGHRAHIREADVSERVEPDESQPVNRQSKLHRVPHLERQRGGATPNKPPADANASPSKMGRPAMFKKPLPKTITMSERAWKLLNAEADKLGVSRSDVVELCIIRVLGRKRLNPRGRG